MGRDKARLDLDGASLIERAIDVLAPLVRGGGDVWLACGAEERYAELGRPLCRDRFADGGPLAGIESGLAAAPEGWVCVLAVDMPRATSARLSKLLDRARNGGADAVLARSATGDEPLFGVYHTRLLGAVRHALERGERKVVSFIDAPLDALLDGSRGELAGPRPRVEWQGASDFEADGDDFATNINTPDDLERELARRTPPGARPPLRVTRRVIPKASP